MAPTAIPALSSAETLGVLHRLSHDYGGQVISETLAVDRAEQNGVAGIVASVNGMAFIASPAVGVLIYTYASALPFWIAVTMCLFIFGWGFKTLKLDETPNQDR